MKKSNKKIFNCKKKTIFKKIKRKTYSACLEKSVGFFKTEKIKRFVF